MTSSFKTLMSYTYSRLWISSLVACFHPCCPFSFNHLHLESLDFRFHAWQAFSNLRVLVFQHLHIVPEGASLVTDIVHEVGGWVFG